MNIDAPITADKVKDVDSADFFQMETKLNAWTSTVIWAQAGKPSDLSNDLKHSFKNNM